MKQIYKILRENSVRGIGIAVMFVLLASFAGALPNAYIPNFDDDNVSVIDTASNTVIANVNVGNGPSGVAVNPMGTKVYVANQLSNDISVIDTTTNTVTTTVHVGNDPIGVAINPMGTKVYVTNYGNKTVSVIDTTTNTVIATVPVGNPFGVVVNPTGTKVYVANGFTSQTVSVIDATTNTVDTIVPVGNEPIGIAINPAGTKVYVANQHDSTVSVIDTATNTVSATVTLGAVNRVDPTGVAIDPSGKRVYITDFYSDNVSVIDTASNAIIATVPVGNGPWGVSVNPAGTMVYVGNGADHNVSVIDTASNTVITSVNVGLTPSAFGQFIGPALGPIGSISGIKFEDINANHEFDSGEPGLGGWTINLKNDDTGVTESQTTLPDGNYSFTNLIDGNYTVGEDLQSGWIQTVPSSRTTYKLQISLGNVVRETNATIANFGNFKLGEIRGKKFNDTNGNGIKDPEDSNISGWQINIVGTDTLTNTQVNQTLTTDPNGNYHMFNLTPGTYTISEEMRPGYIQTAPGTINYTVFIINSSTVIIDKDFGNFKFGEVHGTKFEDLNANGIKDTGEAGLQGWQINLNGTDTITNTPVNKTIATDINGDYSFTELTNGTYTITETNHNGWTQSVPVNGTYTVTITSGANLTGKDFGNFHKGKITGGGYISVKGEPKATFGLVGQYPDSKSGAQGNVEYQDHATGLNIKSTEIDSVATTLDKKKGVITGKAMINKAGPYPFVVYVEDNGEPGKGVDMFNISVASQTPYINGAILSSGNIQIHQ